MLKSASPLVKKRMDHILFLTVSKRTDPWN
ncbi:Uncharacterised protein [Trueperella bialowiezensis]|uniref:Uncharacterized protein n=1 Tax=Trueperella bialowiezensis TaxID=312285 RepID=A0A448PGS0_9ACTO|nr:Uncharacterised protein [Trueperella bialowiezensis]